MFELTKLDTIQIGMASPEMILSWSKGEVTKPETINYRTLKPERDGLFCERIFGPTKDFECACGAYKRNTRKDPSTTHCPHCHVELTKAKVRRERMGHIVLAAPVSHIWYFKGVPCRMGTLLDLPPKDLEKVLYFANFIVLNPGDVTLRLPVPGQPQNSLQLRRGMLLSDVQKRECETQNAATRARLLEELEASNGKYTAIMKTVAAPLSEAEQKALQPMSNHKLVMDSVFRSNLLVLAREQARAAGAPIYEAADRLAMAYLDEADNLIAQRTEEASKLPLDQQDAFVEAGSEDARSLEALAATIQAEVQNAPFRIDEILKVCQKEDGTPLDVSEEDVTAAKEAVARMEALQEIHDQIFDAKIGAEAVKQLLHELDLVDLSVKLKAQIAKSQKSEQARGTESQKRVKDMRRMEEVEAFRLSGQKPEWMILDVLPVIPPDLRPMVQLDGGRFATSDLNDLYRRVINRNNRLKRLLDLGAPDIIVRNEKRMLQEAVDALIDNGRRGRPVTGPSNRNLKSLSNLLKGKQGRFRQNLLGKRVDYSGRSVIVVGPEMKLYQCGLPKEMALELFKPFVMERLVTLKKDKVSNIKSAKRLLEKMNPDVWDILEEVIKEHPVLLNRAPTLHRLGIQAFEPILVEGKAIKLHPLACTAFNADFDGDQMAVHVPLSMEAQAEARFLMLSYNNILKPQDGKPVITLSQDMVIGAYYLTMVYEGEELELPDAQDAEATEQLVWHLRNRTAAEEILNPASGEVLAARDQLLDAETIAAMQAAGITRFKAMAKGAGRAFQDEDEAHMAYATGQIMLQSPIRVRIKRSFTHEDGTVETGTRLIQTTLGRLIFNDSLPQNLGFKKRTCLEDMFQLEVDELVGKKQLANIVDQCFRSQGEDRCAEVLDNLKNLGYRYATVSAVTVSVADIKVPKAKAEKLAEYDEKVKFINESFDDGLLSEDERYEHVIKLWNACTGEIRDEILPNLDRFNPIRMMTDSGARGSSAQVSQLAGMRGLMASPSGKTIELPIRANFREGLSVLEFFLSSHGSRKALADTALRTADSGYLTRRLVDVAQEVIIQEEDCFKSRNQHVQGITISELRSGKQVVEPLEDRLRGRTAAADIKDPETGEVICTVNTPITAELAKEIVSHGVTSAQVRSVLTCRCQIGVCAACYGANMAHGGKVDIGEAVGIIAAQAIGEPGTQLTMRNFHSGGVATSEDITQGLPRVEELFEARKTKRAAILAGISGEVEVKESGKKREVVITSPDGEHKTYDIVYGSTLKVETGSHVEAGDELVDGSVNPHELLSIKGVTAVQDYLLREVLSVYRLQGVNVADKHIEIIIRQMLRRVRIENSGDTDLLPGSTVDIHQFHAANDEAISRGKMPADAKHVLLGITKASLATDSFLSAASFQETTRVLTEAAIKGKKDPLHGLKENVIIGKIIPAGTGMSRYKDIKVREQN